MKKRIQRNFVVTGLLFLLFGLFLMAVRHIDVQAIGADGSSVGLATINQYVFQALGVNLLWYTITDWLGVVAILVAFGFAVLGGIQFITRKSLLRVDADILILGIYYVVVVAVYALFEVFIVNYRPIIMDEGLEPSFPSSHTMIVMCIMMAAVLQFRQRIKNRIVRIVAEIASISVILITVVGRLISGVHWFTDIVGGILLSVALVMLYYSITKCKQVANSIDK